MKSIITSLIFFICSWQLLFAQVHIDSLTTNFYSDTSFIQQLSDSILAQVTIEVSQPKSIGTIRVIDFNPVDNHQKVESIVDTVYGWWGPPQIKFVDITFDNALDVILMVKFGRTSLYRFYIFNPITFRYDFCVSCKEIMGNIAIDSVNRKIISYTYWQDFKKLGSATNEFIIKDGFPVIDSIKVISQEYDTISVD
jgi:hypothetical protein